MTLVARHRVCANRLRRGVASLILVFLGVVSAQPGGGEPSGLTPAAVDNSSFNILTVGRPSLRTFTSKDGLPQNAITAIVTDTNGLLWIGTKDGIASYNGRTWQVLNMPPEVGDNMISDLVPASNGDMWVSLHGGDLVCRHSDGTWSHYREPDGPEGGVQVLLAELDEPGRPATMVFLSQRSFARFLDGAWVVDSEFPIASPGVAGAANVVIGDGGVKELWTGLTGGQTARRRLGVWTIFPAYEQIPGDTFFCFARTSALTGQSQLVAGRTVGISVFDGERWIPEPSAARDGRLDNIFRICESRSPDGSLALWCGSIDSQSYRFGNGRWVAFGGDAKLKDGGVWSLLAAGDSRATHAVWIGTGGLGLVRAEFGAWTAIDRTVGLVNESVYSVLVTKDRTGGDVAWIGTISGGLMRFEQGVPKQVTLNNGNWIMWAMCLLDASDEQTERILVGNAGNLMVIENGRVVRVFNQEAGLPGHDVTSLMQAVDSEGRPFVWVGTSGGVCRYVDGAVIPPPPALHVPAGRVTCLAESSSPGGDRTLWVGTEHGLVRFDGEQSFVYTMEHGLPTDSVMSIRQVQFLDDSPELWVGTRAGVARLSLTGSSTPIRILSTASTPALPNNTVYRIEQDASGRLYLPTNRGVARLTPRRPSVAEPGEFDLTVFTTEDGLPNDECNTGASTIDHRGRIWVGTLTGAAIYDPAAEITVAPSRLVVEKQVVVDDHQRPLLANETLAHDNTRLVFEYALLSYNRESATRYQTQLVGYESQPSAWTAQFRREFTSLPSGSYVFRIWGRDALGNITGPVDIRFGVDPPPWWSWWAIGFYVLAAVALGSLGVRWRLRTLAQRNVQLEAAIAQRTAELAHTVDELRISQQSAQEANLAKSVFLANMSHELRTPLNAVLGFAQLLDRVGTLGPQERQKIGIIRRSGEHLLGLINDVLSLAKIEAGKLELHEQPFSPADLLAAVEAMTRVRADAKDLRFEIRIGDGFPAVVHGDDGKLRQVLLNLLGNAVKFTDAGRVRLAADWTDGRASFAISDEGRGISSSETAQLFEAFSQTETGRSAPEGTGLGLIISRQIVRLMGGDITVESEPGKGSTFRFDVSLPASTGDATSRTVRRVRRVVEAERRRRVLVVDDSAENRLLLTSILASVGFDVREAADGRDALGVVAEWRPRVIFMDRRMPVMDGVECTREIRRLESTAGEGSGRVVIIATTASVFEQDREEILSNGCDDLVIKPFQESEIFEMLQRHAGVRFEYEEAPESAEGGGGEGDGIVKLSSQDADVVRRLYQALNAGDTQAASEIASEIRGVDERLGDEIAKRIREFRMETLIEELERVVK